MYAGCYPGYVVVTLCGKNFYGATSTDRNWRKNAHDNFNQDPQGRDKYMTFTDFLGHKDLGGKTLLFMIDGFYGDPPNGDFKNRKFLIAPQLGGWGG